MIGSLLCKPMIVIDCGILIQLEMNHWLLLQPHRLIKQMLAWAFHPAIYNGRNVYAVQTILHLIPGLAPRFLYANPGTLKLLWDANVDRDFLSQRETLSHKETLIALVVWFRFFWACNLIYFFSIRNDRMPFSRSVNSDNKNKRGPSYPIHCCHWQRCRRSCSETNDSWNLLLWYEASIPSRKRLWVVPKSAPRPSNLCL